MISLHSGDFLGRAGEAVFNLDLIDRVIMPNAHKPTLAQVKEKEAYLSGFSEEW